MEFTHSLLRITQTFDGRARCLNAGLAAGTARFSRMDWIQRRRRLLPLRRRQVLSRPTQLYLGMSAAGRSRAALRRKGEVVRYAVALRLGQSLVKADFPLIAPCRQATSAG